MRGFSPSPPSTCLLPSSIHPKTAAILVCSNNNGGALPGSVNSLSSWTKVKPRAGLRLAREEGPCPRAGVLCNSSTGPGGPTSGDGDSKSILDAFFLGRALAEALNERVESAVGELLSTVGRLQAEQQKQIQEFQEDVLERAKKAKDQAAREALGGQGLVSKPITVETAGVSESISVANGYTVIPSNTNPNPSTTPETESDADPATKGSTLGAPNFD